MDHFFSSSQNIKSSFNQTGSFRGGHNRPKRDNPQARSNDSIFGGFNRFSTNSIPSQCANRGAFRGRGRGDFRGRGRGDFRGRGGERGCRRVTTVSQYVPTNQPEKGDNTTVDGIDRMNMVFNRGNTQKRADFRGRVDFRGRGRGDFRGRGRGDFNGRGRGDFRRRVPGEERGGRTSRGGFTTMVQCCEDGCTTDAVVVCTLCIESEEDNEPGFFCNKHDESNHKSRYSRKHKRICVEEWQQFNDVIFKHANDEDIQSDTDNLFFGTNEHDFREGDPVIGCGKGFHKIKKAITEDTIVGAVSFAAATGTGKSLLIRSLINIGLPMPVSAPPGSNQSMSADLHAYLTTWKLPFNEESTNVILFDSEGLRGSTAPKQRQWENVHENIRKQYCDTVFKLFPRLLFMFSDVICYPTNISIQESESYAKDLLDFSILASARTVNNIMPSLCLIFNRRSTADCKDYIQNPKDNDLTCVEIATKMWKESQVEVYDELKENFAEIYVIFIPDFTQNPTETIIQLKQFKLLLMKCVKDSLARRKQLNAEQNRKIMFNTMHIVCKKLYNDPSSSLDYFDLVLREDLKRQILSTPFTTNIIDYFHAIVNTLLENNEVHKAIDAASKEFKDRLILLYQIRWIRICEHTNIDPILAKKEFRELWKSEIKEIGDTINNKKRCNAKKEFQCAKKGSLTVRCQEVYGNHSSHRSTMVYYDKTKSKFFKRSKTKKNKCMWSGKFEGKKFSLSSVKKAFLENDIPTREQILLKWSKYNMDSFLQKNKEISSRICLQCGFNFPDLALTCGHGICSDCSKLLNDLSLDGIECVFCNRYAVDSHKEVPSRAGCRILSLDGGGTRGIIQITMLKEILNIIHNSKDDTIRDLTLRDLFDLIIGTSAGGIISLFLANADNTLDDAETILTNIATDVFKVSAGSGVRKIGSMVTNKSYAKYDSAKLKTHFSKIHEIPLRGCSKPKGPVVAVTMVDLESKKIEIASSKPVRKIKTNDFEDIGHLVSNVDSAMATSAAPTFFWAVPIGGKKKCDGGLLANCPAHVGVNIASRIWEGKEIDVLLSLGTGYSSKKSKENETILDAIDVTTSILTDSERLFGECRNLIKEKDYLIRLSPVFNMKLKLDISNEKKLKSLSEKTVEYLKKLI